jgi:peptidoglycan/LPS O-acetylase OafA/YrhL
MNQVKIDYRLDIQLLRGVAVLLVLFYHLKINGFNNGYLGVDVFFVISGYLMAIICKTTSPFNFYIKRLKRLLPAYFFTIILTSIVVCIVSIPSDAQQYFNRLWFDLFGVSNIAYWLKNSYFNLNSFQPLLNLWSLGVEIQFYAIAPLILLYLSKHKVIFFFLLIISTIITFTISEISTKTSFFLMPLRLYEFLIGAAVAWYPIKKFSEFKNEKIIIFLFVLFLIIIFFYPIDVKISSSLYGHPGLASLLISIITALIISINFNKTSLKKKLIINSFCKIGDYSYSIYLVHFPIIVLINYSAFGGTEIGFNDLNQLFLILSLTLLLSYFSYNYIETIRFKDYFKKFIIFLISIILVVIIFFPKINSFQYSLAQKKIFSAWEDRERYRCGKLFRILNPLKSICEIGDKLNSKSVLLLGDSHADSIKNIFATQMNKDNISTFFYVFNTPLMIPKTNSDVISKDLINTNIHNVVIHYSKGFYSKDYNIKQLKKFIANSNSNNINIYFISPVPSYKFNIPKKLYGLHEKGQHNPPTFANKNYYLENKHFFELMKELKINLNSIFLSNKFLCENQKCIIMDEEGKPIYFDTMHLTLTGAKKLKDLFNSIGQQIN